MPKLYLIITSLLISVAVFAQTGSLKGKLVFKDGTPLSYATVSIQPLKKNAVTDENGAFILQALPYGSHTLEIQSLEIESLSYPVVVNQANQKIMIRVEERDAHALSDVVVMGKNASQIAKDRGFVANVIDTKKFALQSIQSNDLLDRMAGVRIRQSGGIGSDYQFNINGLSGESVKIFIDGIPIKNYGPSFSLSSIPPAMIDRIEVYKGVVPIHLAADALGGAVNVILKNEARNQLTASYSYGSFNTHQFDLNGSYRDAKSGFTVQGSGYFNHTDNNYKVWGDQIYLTNPATGKKEYVTAKRFHDDYQSKGIKTNLGFTDKKWADELMLGLLYSDMKKDIQHGATMEVVYGNRHMRQDTKMADIKYAKRNILPSLDINAFASFSATNRALIDTIAHMYNWQGEVLLDENGNPYVWNKGGGEAGKKSLEENMEKNMAGKINLSYRIHPQHAIRANILYNHFLRDVDDPLRAMAERELMDTRHLGKMVSGISYENRLFEDKFKGSLFYKNYWQTVRLADPEKVDGILVSKEYKATTLDHGYGGAISFAITPQWQIYASAEKAVRLPSNNELLGNTADNIEVSYDLKPERSTNINLGVNIGQFLWGNHALSGEVNLFYRDIRDLITRSVTSATAETYGYENLGHVRSTGIDLQLNYQYDQKLSVGWNLSNPNARFALQHDEHGVEYVYYGDRLRNTPFFTTNTEVSYRWENFLKKGANLTLGYHLGYVHQFYRNWESLGGANKAVIPSQLTHDASITYQLPKPRLSFSVDFKNFTNEQVFDNWALQKPGRAIFGKITYKIF